MKKGAQFPDTDAIIVTLSMQTIKERRGGLRQILAEWRDADGERSVWWYKCGTAPGFTLCQKAGFVTGNRRGTNVNVFGHTFGPRRWCGTFRYFWKN